MTQTSKIALIGLLAWIWPIWAGACEIIPLFSPFDDVEAALVAELQHAQTSIHASLFGISNETLTQVLAEKARHRLDVSIALDKRQSALKSDTHGRLHRAGAAVTIKKTTALEHNKFVILDGETVVMGSWNWSGNAQKQDNSDVIFRDCPDLAAEYEEAFQRIVERDR